MDKLFKIKFRGKEFVASTQNLHTLQVLVSTTSDSNDLPQLSMVGHGDYRDKTTPIEQHTWILENLEIGDSFKFDLLESGEITPPIEVMKIGTYVERCSFCGKRKNEVQLLIKSERPIPAHICNECVVICMRVIQEEGTKKS